MSVLAQERGFGHAIAAVRNAIKTLDRIPLFVVQLPARFAIAAVFWRSAQSKLANWDLTVQLFQDEYRVPLLPPDIAALMGATFELSCPVLLVLGFATRLATLPLLGMTAVIQLFVYPQNWPEHLTWATLLLLLLLRGGGMYSLDHFLARTFGPGR